MRMNFQFENFDILISYCSNTSNDESYCYVCLNAAHQDISSISIQAKQQFGAGMKALSNGDSNSAVLLCI
jgi:hypothetical protein